MTLMTQASSSEHLQFSVIIPAFNEADVIGRLLNELTQESEHVSLEIIVVCNGCSDDTALQARRWLPAETVVELSVGSKTQAINLGLKKAQFSPKVLIDADIFITLTELVKSVRYFLASKKYIASPAIQFNTDGASAIVQAYYQAAFWSDYNQRTLLSNVILLSKTAEIRVGVLPELVADDAYIQAQFSQQEMISIRQARYTFFTPRTLNALVKTLIRVARGNQQLQAWLVSKGRPQHVSSALAANYLNMCKRGGLGSFIIFVLIKLWVKLSTMLCSQHDAINWDQDRTSRK